MSESDKFYTLPFEITANSIINSTVDEESSILQDITMSNDDGIEYSRGNGNVESKGDGRSFSEEEKTNHFTNTPSKSNFLLDSEDHFSGGRIPVARKYDDEDGLGLDDISIPLLDESNQDSEILSVGSHSQPKENCTHPQNFSISEIISNLRKPSGEDNENLEDTTHDQEENETDLREEIEQSVLNISALNFSRVEPQLNEFKEAILQRDTVIKNLINSYQQMEEQLMEKTEELKKVTEVAEEMENLQEIMRGLADNSEKLRNQTLLDQFELSSYMSPPEDPGGKWNDQRSEGDGRESRTVNDQVCQTDNIPIKRMIEVSSQTKVLENNVEELRENCAFLKSSAESLRSETTGLKDLVTQNFKIPPEIHQLSKIFECTQKFQEDHQKEIATLRDELDGKSKVLVNVQSELRQLENANSISGDVLKEKVSEIQLLKAKVAELEDAKKSSDLRLTSFSSRLSPEGSELETDLSLNDSHSTAAQTAVLENFPTTRPKMEYLKLTPPLEGDDCEEYNSLPEYPSRTSLLDDLNLQVSDLTRKLDANLKYLNEQAVEREIERDEFSRKTTCFENRIEDLKKENSHFEKVIENQKVEIDDLEVRLKEATEAEQDLLSKGDKVEDELKLAVDKIYELREIIRDLEDQIDCATHNACELKERNEHLTDEVEKLESEVKRQGQDLNSTLDSSTTLVSDDMADDLNIQVKELTGRLIKKVNELESNITWGITTRPNSSCSGALSASTEEISTRELSFLNKDMDMESNPLQLAEGLRQLEIHFDSLVRFEDVILKKMNDTELRLTHSKKREEELQSKESTYVDDMRAKEMKISDLESRLEQYRFQPAPNTVTLSGMKTRLATLSEEVEEYKGQCQLKNIELKELKSRLEASQALLAVHGSSPKRVSPTFRKISAATQTDKSGGIKWSTSSAQTVPSHRNFSVQVRTASIQTTNTSTRTQGSQKNWNYPNIGLEALELSTIQGEPAPTHSTPNEILEIRKGIRNSNTSGTKTWAERVLTRNSSQGSPEVLREPYNLVTSSRLQVDPLYDGKSICSVPSSAEPNESEDEMGFLDVVEVDSDEAVDGKKKQTKKGKTPGYLAAEKTKNGPKSPDGNKSASSKKQNLASDKLASPGSAQSIDSKRRDNSFVDEEASRTRVRAVSFPESEVGPSRQRIIPSSFDDDQGVPPPSVSDFVITENLDDLQKEPAVVLVHKETKTSTHSSQLLRTINSRNVSKEVQTPPLAISSLIDALDEEEKANLFEAMNRLRGEPLDEDEKDTEIQKLLKRIRELEDKLKSGRASPCPESCNNVGTMRMETIVDFDRSMVPKSAETHMNYVVTPMDCDDEKAGNTQVCNDTEYLEKLSALTTELELDQHKLGVLTPEETTVILRALKDGVTKCKVANATMGDSQGTKSTPPKKPAYSYTLDTSCDYAEGDNADLTLVDESGKVIPSKSNATISLKDSKDEKNSFSRSTDWEEMENRRASRLQDVDTQIMLETAKAQFNQLKLALENEKKNTTFYKDQADFLSKKLGGDASQNLDGKLGVSGASSENRTQSIRSDDYENRIRGLQEQLFCFQRAHDHIQKLYAIEQENCIKLGEQVHQVSCEYQVMKAAAEKVERALRERDNKLDKAVSCLTSLEQERATLTVENQALNSTITQLQAQIENIHSDLIGSMGRPMSQSNQQGGKSWELYLRAKSFRKALTWQKKYLIIVIHEYKDLMKGMGESIHPHLLQKEIPITPTSVGKVNHQSKLTRFRIIGRVIIATIRMSWMVRRWSHKLVAGSEGSSTSNSKENSPPSTSSNSLSPPTRDQVPTKRVRILSLPTRRVNTDGILQDPHASVFVRPRNPPPKTNRLAPSNLATEARRKNEALSEYIERFKYLQSEIGRVVKPK